MVERVRFSTYPAAAAPIKRNITLLVLEYSVALAIAETKATIINDAISI
jgi:hypothetical protein